MNKEEYKADIIEQFKTPFSALRILMVEPEFARRLSQNYYRKKCGIFMDTDPKLYFEVEEISNGLDGVFSVAFKDSMDIKQVSQPCIGFKYEDASTKPYYIETIRYVNDKITFFLECCTINMDFDRNITKNILLNRDVVTFDIKKLDFELDDNLDVIVSNWYSFRKSYKELYIDFKPDFYNREQLNNFLNINIADIKTISSIHECFKNITPIESVPNMVQVVFNLRDFVNDKIKSK